jgi:RNA recognition motif-containing protein
MDVKLFVGNLSPNTNEQDLHDMFSKAGTVASVNVIRDRDTGRSRGFAFVEMSTQAEAEKAISMLHGKIVAERPMVVNKARPREERPSAFGPRPKRHDPRRGQRRRF